MGNNESTGDRTSLLKGAHYARCRMDFDETRMNMFRQTGGPAGSLYKPPAGPPVNHCGVAGGVSPPLEALRLKEKAFGVFGMSIFGIVIYTAVPYPNLLRNRMPYRSP